MRDVARVSVRLVVNKASPTNPLKTRRIAVRGSFFQWHSVYWILVALSIACVHADPQDRKLGEWQARFESEVDRRVNVPLDQQQRYIELLRRTLDVAGFTDQAARSWVVIDRSANVQAMFLLVSAPPDRWIWLGASPVSTGRPGSYDHFETPIGIYVHSLDNPDFRAAGTYNENHVRGYGVRGMRVFDFGWVMAVRGWGTGAVSPMRLQMHATDPERLESLLGATASKGCIRIASSLNRFLDRHAVLDADYLNAMAAGRSLWIMAPVDEPLPWPGRYLVVLDSGMPERPSWAIVPTHLSH